MSQWLWIFSWEIQLGGHWLPLLHQCLDPPTAAWLPSPHLGEINLDSIPALLLLVRHLQIHSFLTVVHDLEYSESPLVRLLNWCAALVLELALNAHPHTHIHHTHWHACSQIGVYLSLKGTVFANNSVIPITEIGTTSNTGLQCITDRRPCCGTQGSRAGEWFFPDGNTVPAQGGATSFYRNTGDGGIVTLNRLNTNVEMPYGKFCCAVPDNVRLCINISKINLHNLKIDPPNKMA